VSRLNVLWCTDHCCYDGILHAGGRLFENVIPRFDPERFQIFPCMIRASDAVRALFEAGPLDVNIFDRNRFDFRTVGTFVRLIRKHKIDVLHLHCYGTSVYGRLAGMWAGVPRIIHDYDTDFYFPYPWYLGEIDRVLAPFTDGAIASNPLVREFTIQRRHVSPERVRLMFHPVLDDRYAPVPEERVREMREKLDVPAGARIVGALTKLAPERGNELLLEAAKQVVAEHPEAIFLFVYSPTEFHRLPRGYDPSKQLIGRDRNREALETRARELGISKNVRFFETVDVPVEVEAALDVSVAPWLSERFSVARLLDALPKGAPLVAADVGEPRAIVEHGVNGFLVEPTAEALAAKVSLLLADRELHARLSEGARRSAQRYHIDTFVRSLEDWYTELAKKKRRA
jgi:glycosyltransferase involved in cell wall biosynthesis